MFSYIKRMVAGLLFFLGLSVAAFAQATVPTEITGMTDNASTVWTTVKGIIVGVVGFLILLRFVKLVAKR